MHKLYNVVIFNLKCKKKSMGGFNQNFAINLNVRKNGSHHLIKISYII